MAGLALHKPRVRQILCVLMTSVSGLALAFGEAHCSPLPHEVYVWQRAWNEPVCRAVSQHASSFSNLVVLAAEVTWRQRQPETVRAHLDFAVLREIKTPIGLALRIGPFPGPFDAEDNVAQYLAALADSLVAEAVANGVKPAELQLDFDCAESKLEGYCVWVGAIRKKIAPVPLTITALPGWLKQPAFSRLIGVADGYVLQVHSLEKPAHYDAPLTLCDPAAARKAVARAESFGVPFRVALPTYGYVVAFSKDGRFVGLSAEGPRKSWPGDVRLREVRADALALSGLVQDWSTNRPAHLRGVIWYRLPVVGENLNWRWATLAAIVGLRTPRESVNVAARRVGTGLVEISLVNDGELDLSSRLTMKVHWQGAHLVAGDALSDFELVEEDASTVTIKSRLRPCFLSPGDQRVAGWLRLDKDCEVRVELQKD